MGPSPQEPAAAVPADELGRFAELAREHSAATVTLHARVAERMGLSGTDHKCLDLAMRAAEPLTAGRIAALSGLSTGAVTGVIDRLERRGLVRRVRDPHDRRKVLVAVSRVDGAEYERQFRDAAAATERVLARFEPAERAVIERYLRAVLDEFPRSAE